MAEDNISEILQNMKYCSKYGAGQTRERHLAAKLALLKELQTMLRKNELQQTLLDKGLLCIIALWLKPQNVGNLALYSIRQKLLKLLLHHCKCIKKGHLSKSKLGKIVFKLSSHPAETVANRRLATKLFTTWARDVYKIQTDHRGISSKDRMQKEMDQVSEQAMAVDTTPTQMHATASIEEPDVAESANVTMCEATIAVNQPATVDLSQRTSVSKQGSFISVFHNENLAEDSVNELLQLMEHCTKHEEGQDSEQHEAGRLALLNELETMLRKNELQQALLDKGLLCIIALWLKPQNDGHLPLYSIRQKLLKLLLHHCKCIKKGHLSKSKLGKIVFKLSSHPAETVANRRLATKLITTWARDVYNIQTDYLGISSKDQMQKEVEQVSEQATIVDTTPTQHSTAAIEEPDVTKSGNVTMCEETVAVYQPAAVDPLLHTVGSKPGSFVSPSSRISIADAYNISDDQMRKCDQILDSFFKKKNQMCSSRVNLG